MSRLISLSGRLLIGGLCFLSAAATAQEECVSIENDISRLQCFDEAFSGIAPESLSPSDAFARLSQLIESEYGGFRVGAGFNSCALMLFALGSRQGWMGPTLRIVVLGAGDVETETVRWWDDGFSLNAYMRRGTVVYEVAVGGEKANEGNLRAFSDRFSRDGLEGVLELSRDIGIDGDFTRSFAIRAVTDESRVDRGRIADALKGVANSCQS